MKRAKPAAVMNSKSELSAFESVTLALKDQVLAHETLSIDNLSKVYSNGKKAVHGITLEMYKG